MARDASGNYTLPLDSVVAGTSIDAEWANPTMDDVADAITDSLSRSGKGTMNVALQYAAGSSQSPGIGFTAEPSSGFYYFGTGDLRASVLGQPSLRFIDESGTAVGNQRPTMIYNGNAFQPILKGDATESPIFKGFSTVTPFGNMVVEAGGVDITAGGLTTTAGDLDVVGDVTMTGVATAATVNGSTTTGYAVVDSTGTLSYGVNASSARVSTGVYTVTFTSAPAKGSDGENFCIATLLDTTAIATITYATLGNTVYIYIISRTGVVLDRDFTVFTLLAP